MSQEECVRISLLESNIETHSRRIDDILKKFTLVEQKQNEILNNILKVKYFCIGSAGLILVDNLGLAAALKAFI